MADIRVLNPVSELRGPAQTSDPALRPNNLEGKNGGVVWNRKRGGDAVLNRGGSKLKEKYQNIDLTLYEGGIPTPADVLDKVAAECDVAIGSSSD